MADGWQIDKPQNQCFCDFCLAARHHNIVSDDAILYNDNTDDVKMFVRATIASILESLEYLYLSHSFQG